MTDTSTFGTFIDDVKVLKETRELLPGCNIFFSVTEVGCVCILYIAHYGTLTSRTIDSEFQEKRPNRDTIQT